MSEKVHQTHKSEYQIRIDGKPVYWPNMFDKSALEKYAELCKENDGCYVDIVRVNTQILMSQFEYHQMKRHFEAV